MLTVAEDMNGLRNQKMHERNLQENNREPALRAVKRVSAVPLLCHEDQCKSMAGRVVRTGFKKS